MVRKWRWQLLGWDGPFPLPPSSAGEGFWPQKGGAGKLRDGFRTGLVLVVFVAVIVVTALVLDRTTSGPEEAAAVQTATHELPPEWRWERDTISFEHMYSDPISRAEPKAAP